MEVVVLASLMWIRSNICIHSSSLTLLIGFFQCLISLILKPKWSWPFPTLLNGRRQYPMSQFNNRYCSMPRTVHSFQCTQNSCAPACLRNIINCDKKTYLNTSTKFHQVTKWLHSSKLRFFPPTCTVSLSGLTRSSSATTHTTTSRWVFIAFSPYNLI